jgi:hypothetical protein
MIAVFIALLASLRATMRSRFELAAEILALRHQLAVLQRTAPKRPRLRPIDRLLWMLLSSVWPNWRQAVQIVTPATWYVGIAARSPPIGAGTRDPAASAGQRWQLTSVR